MKKTLLVAAALACGAATAPALAQRVHDVPARPALFAGADTNSAGAYYLAGLQSLDQGQKVSFEIEPDKKGKGPKAVDIVVLSDS